MITTPLKIFTRQLQYHQYQSATYMNLNPDLNSEAATKHHRFQKANNHTTTTSETSPEPITSIREAKPTLEILSDIPEETATFI